MAIRTIRIPRAVGFGAGVLALSLLVFSIAGAIWGMFRPELSGKQQPDGSVVIDPVTNVEFTSFITFVLITALGSVVLGTVVFAAAPPRFRGLSTLLWVGFVAIAGAYAFVIFGNWSAGTADGTGSNIEFVPPLDPGVFVLVAPFFGMFAYWSAVFVGGDD